MRDRVTSLEQQRSRPRRVLVVSDGGAWVESVLKSLTRTGIMGDRARPGADGWEPHGPADAVVLDMDALSAAGVDLATVVDRALATARLDLSMPILAVAPGPVTREDRRQWLEAGAWDVLALPVDEEVLGLILTNLLRGRPPPPDRPPRPDDPALYRAGYRKDPYPWRVLVRVIGETLLVARRHRRPLACVSFVPEWNEPRSTAGPILLADRLARSILPFVRGDDLVGLTEQGAILVILPETTPDGARAIQVRMLKRLQDQIRVLGMLTGIRTATVHAGGDDDPGEDSAARLLLRAVSRAR
jgi:DNA-binding response OmpR family regulator